MARGTGKKGPRREVPPSPYRAVLSINLKKAMSSTPELSSSPKLDSKSKVAFSTINRLRRAETAADLDTLTALASAFGLEPWQLLVREFDPKNPPRLAGPADRDLIVKAVLEAAHAVTNATRLKARDAVTIAADDKRSKK